MIFIDSSQLLTFTLAATVLNILPGADVLFICGQSLQGGRRHAISAALGSNIGGVIYVIITALGISKVFQYFPSSFDIIRGIGIIYMVYLSWKSFKNKDPLFDAELNQAPSKSLVKTFKEGMFTTLLNPKVGLFFLTFLPQFTNSFHETPFYVQILFLGFLFIISDIVIAIGYALAASKARTYILSNKYIQNNLQKITGYIFASLAILLAWDDFKRFSPLLLRFFQF